MAATANKKVLQRGTAHSSRYEFPVLAGVRIFTGTIAGVTANREAVPVGHASCVAALGLALDPADNRAGATGDKKILVGTGVFNLSDMLPAAVPANVRSPVYCDTDDKLKLVGTGAKTYPIGVIEALDAEGLWVKI